jgi:hypothetical protein
MALLPNTGENDDRAVANRGRHHARAASLWFEDNKVTHWLFSGSQLRASPRKTGFFSPAKPTVRSLKRFSQDDEK